MCRDSASGIGEPAAVGFAEQGYRFIPIREAHLSFIGWMMGRQAPDMASIFGAAMVNTNFIPVAMALAYFEDDGTVSIHAHFGKWLKRFPKDILRHMSRFCRTLRDMGHPIVYAIADESIEGSDTLIRWFKGRSTGQRHEFGMVYEIDLRKAKI